MRGSLFVASLVCLACVNTASVDAGEVIDAGQGGGGGALEMANCGLGYGGGGAVAYAGVFPSGIAWNQGANVSPRSATIISALQAEGGWGNGDKLQIDFSLAVLTANAGTPKRMVSAAPGYCDGGPDCDALPLQIPLPANGYAEASADYACNTADSGCRVLVVEDSRQKLYELRGVTVSGGAVTAHGVFVWELGKPWGFSLRGDQCFSADESGLPVAALLVTADEADPSGVGFGHALRLTLPSTRVKPGVFVRPATHGAPASSPNPDAPPMGMRLKLKANFDETPFGPSARRILRAHKSYGMILSGTGETALSFADDRLSTAKWSTLGINANTFESLRVDDFEVAGLCAEIPLTSECVRVP